MRGRYVLAAALCAALLASRADAQVTIQRLGDNPLTVERDEDGNLLVSGGAGAQLRLGQTTINSGGGTIRIMGAPIDGARFLRPRDGGLDADTPALSVQMRVSPPFTSAAGAAERIDALVGSGSGLDAAMGGQCELAKAAFGVDCRMGELNLRQRLDVESAGPATADIEGDFMLIFPRPATSPAAAR